MQCRENKGSTNESPLGFQLKRKATFAKNVFESRDLNKLFVLMLYHKGTKDKEVSSFQDCFYWRRHFEFLMRLDDVSEV